MLDYECGMLSGYKQLLRLSPCSRLLNKVLGISVSLADWIQHSTAYLADHFERVTEDAENRSRGAPSFVSQSLSTNANLGEASRVHKVALSCRA